MNNKKLRSDLKRDEGYELKPYQDTEGKWTIGVGHNYEANGFDLDILTMICKHGFTTDVAELLLTRDIELAIVDCKKLYSNWDSINDDRQASLANMSFNLGLGRLRGFRNMNKAVMSEDWETVSVEALDSRWSGQVGKRADRIAFDLRGGMQV